MPQRTRRAWIVVPILAAALVTGCGDDDDEQAAEDSKISIEASGGKGI